MTQPIHPTILERIETAFNEDGTYVAVRDEDYVSVQFDPTGNEAIHVEPLPTGEVIVTVVGYDGRGGVSFEQNLFGTTLIDYIVPLVKTAIASQAETDAPADL